MMNMMKKRIIRDYLSSLKEDNELDYIFPILLSAMNFRLISTPRNSKGQSQYGKDVVAIGKDADGKICRWYFELKGNAAKDINDTTFNVKDGVRDSILAAIDVSYTDSSIPSLNNLPEIIVFVHNGILVENNRTQFDSFIAKHFPKGGFERWDIEVLTDLFSKYLFDENLFCDDESYTLFKKILVYLDTPGLNVADLDRLIDIQLSLCPTDGKKKRTLIKCFAALNLMLVILFSESQKNENLLPAKIASDRLVLKLWAWMLKHNMTENNLIKGIFGKIVYLHLQVYSSYINKILPLAQMYKGLYLYRGGESERICYPLRCYDFLNDLLYYLNALQAYNRFTQDNINELQALVMKVIEMNSGFDMPLLDTHSITLQLLTKFLFCRQHKKEIELSYFHFIVKLVINVIMRKRDYDMYPELHSNKKALAESLYKKSPDYQDTSSLFLLSLIEILAWMDYKELYAKLREQIILSKINLQVAYPIVYDDLEIRLFEHRLYEEMSVETNIQLDETLDEFKKNFRKKYNHIYLKTENTEYRFLQLLAHIHYQTDMFPDFLNLGFWEPLSKEKKENNQ